MRKALRMIPLAALMGCSIPGDWPADVRQGLDLASQVLDIVECSADPACASED